MMGIFAAHRDWVAEGVRPTNHMAIVQVRGSSILLCNPLSIPCDVHLRCGNHCLDVEVIAPRLVIVAHLSLFRRRRWP